MHHSFHSFLRCLTRTALVVLAALLTFPSAPTRAEPSSARSFTKAAEPARAGGELLEETVRRASELASLHTLIVARDGAPLVERAFGRHSLDEAVNVKSISKTIIAALAGAAIERGILDGVDQPAAAVLAKDLPDNADPRLNEITIGHLLAMRSGLERTSGANYGAWIGSRNWVRYALAQPFVDEPGGNMLYSTGNSHLLSAILTKSAKRSTLELARGWLGEPLGIAFAAWERDPQGIYLGGNNMALSPRALLRFGEMYRNGGVHQGVRVLPESWIDASWTPQARSRHTGHAYGYGWFITEMRGHPVYYAWGYGGQMLYVVPSLRLTVVMTSDPNAPSGRTGYVRELHALVADGIIPALQQAEIEATGALDGAAVRTPPT